MSTKLGAWFENGQEVHGVSPLDRGFQYGDGLFETVAVRNGDARLWPYHVERLQRGGTCLGLTLPGEQELSVALQKALDTSAMADQDCVAKIVLTAGDGARGYGRVSPVTAKTVIGIFDKTDVPAASYRDGIDTILCRTTLATGSALAGLKTLNRLEQVMARSEVLKAGCYEGLTADADGNLICGTMSNVFFVKNKSISTPDLQSCGVEGVMRRHIIATLTKHGRHVAQYAQTATALNAIDEVFICNSQFGVLAVRSCDRYRWGVGETTKTVMAMMADAGVAECRV